MDDGCSFAVHKFGQHGHGRLPIQLIWPIVAMNGPISANVVICCESSYNSGQLGGSGSTDRMRAAGHHNPVFLIEVRDPLLLFNAAVRRNKFSGPTSRKLNFVN